MDTFDDLGAAAANASGPLLAPALGGFGLMVLGRSYCRRCVEMLRAKGSGKPESPPGFHVVDLQRHAF